MVYFSKSNCGQEEVVTEKTAAMKIVSIRSFVSNCYLLKAAGGWVLVDTGVSFRRGALKDSLKAAGCGPGDLQLVIITHGDFDHTGNCAWLKERYRAKLAAHAGEVPALETGRMMASRKHPRGTIATAVMNLAGKLVFKPFKPDVLLEDGDDLSPYGLDARIIHLPGHTTGHIGVLTAAGDLFCGDLLGNQKRPEKFSLIDDDEEMNASIERLKELPVTKVYPGHGLPFNISELKTSEKR